MSRQLKLNREWGFTEKGKPKQLSRNSGGADESDHTDVIPTRSIVLAERTSSVLDAIERALS